MTKFWWSGEVEGDAFDPYRETMKAIEAVLNRLLEGVSLGPKIEQWAFVAIIRTEDHPDYDEVAKKSSKGKVLEFRLKVPYAEFARASRNGQIRLILGSLSRSVTRMEKLGVPTETQNILNGILARAEEQLIQQKSKAELRLQ